MHFTSPLTGTYETLERLGSGSFGEVWKARGPKGNEVALKLVNLKHNVMNKELRGVELVKNFEHPHLLSVHDFWADGGVLHIVMELGDETLHHRMKRLRKNRLTGISPDELIGYIFQVAEALDYLHGKRVFHRDVKPENLILVKGRAKVADYGLARHLIRSAEKVSFAGTPAYMAPEQWGGEIGLASDQYALAVTYAELRQGLSPMPPQPSMADTRIAHEEGRLEFGGPITDGECAVLRKATMRAPKDRYPSCTAFAEALRGSVSMQGSAYSVEQKPEAGWKPASPIPQKQKRKRTGMLVVATLALVGIGAVIAAVKYGSGHGQTVSEDQSKGDGHPNPPGPVEPQPNLEKQQEPKPGEERDFEIADGVKMRFCWIPTGTATLGSPNTETRNEHNQEHSFTTTGFWLGKCEVTQSEWNTVMKGTQIASPSTYDGIKNNEAKGMDTSKFPVESVSWDDCQEFLKQVNTRLGSERSATFKLPHEDEWEYACRGGSGNAQRYYLGAELGKTQANYASSRPMPVGSYAAKAPHPWGLCDMHGNVWEWCANFFADPYRVYRGGSFNYSAEFCTAAFRGSGKNKYYNNLGLRIARVHVR